MDYALSKIIETKSLTDTVHKITFQSEDINFKSAGQYAVIHHEGENIKVPVAEYDSDRFIVVFKLSDDARRSLSKLELGSSVVVETGVGTGFDVQAIPSGAFLVAEGMGIPPMLGLLRQMLMQGKDCNIILCFPNKPGMFMIEQFRNLCGNIEIITLDGSNGREGHSYDAFRYADYVCAFADAEILEKIKEKSEQSQLIELV